MRGFRILLLVCLVSPLLGSIGAAEAGAAPREFLLLDTQPHSVGQYSLLLSLYHPVSRFVSFAVVLGRGTARVSQSHEFLFVLGRDTFTASEDLSSGAIHTGELTSSPGQRPDYGSVDMEFIGGGTLRTVPVPCAGPSNATFSARTGDLGGLLDFNTNTALGAVDVPRLRATLVRFSLPSGCGQGALERLFQLEFGASGGISRCGPDLFLFAGSSYRDGRFADVIAFKSHFPRRTDTILVVDLTESLVETDPAMVFHAISVFGPPGMFAASRSLESARIRGRPGEPFLVGGMHYEATRPPEDRSTKRCDDTESRGRLKGRLVARFDVGGHLVIRSFQAGLIRSEERSEAGGPSRVPVSGGLPGGAGFRLWWSAHHMPGIAPAVSRGRGTG